MSIIVPHVAFRGIEGQNVTLPFMMMKLDAEVRSLFRVSMNSLDLPEILEVPRNFKYGFGHRYLLSQVRHLDEIDLSLPQQPCYSPESQA